MARRFNIAGPCFPPKHYTIETDRCTGNARGLINDGLYFVLHAARQTGKTTTLKALTRSINAEGKYYALYCSLEAIERITDVHEGIQSLFSVIQMNFMLSHIPNGDRFGENSDVDFAIKIRLSLSRFCMLLDKPLIIFFDEADCLQADLLINFLRQLRDGYVSREETPFVHSIALVGMRNIRDYEDQIRGEAKTLGSASPFNIISDAFTLNNFTFEEVAALYQQHTDESGQLFEPDAVSMVWEKTQGQPWLVNAIAYEIIEEQLNRDYSQTIISDMVLKAINAILIRRDTHVDSMLYRLKEPRVKLIVESMILGDEAIFDWTSDDYQYVRDIGLIHPVKIPIRPANPIYNEMICRALSYAFQEEMAYKETPYVMPRYLLDGKIDMDYLMSDFQQFWRENGEIWKDKYDYKEAAPHLIMMAFLQRVINGGGYINRDYALGYGRLDVCVDYEKHRYPIELKLRRGDITYEKAFSQLAGYMDHLGCTEGWLVVFDRRPELAWDEKIFIRKETVTNKTITIVGC
ncbi:MAG: AAA-like domain-containing protein [Tannerella sp.]|jgi:hypothetical protein|nr:AAA-like domain-containing protein [Tannerella sp.]